MLIDRVPRTLLTTIGWMAWLPVTLSAQDLPLSLDVIFDAAQAVNFSGSQPRIERWIDDEHYLEHGEGRSEAPLVKIHANTGRREALFVPARMEAALDRLPGVSEGDARELVSRTQHLLSPTLAGVVINHANDLLYYEFESDRARRLTYTPEPEEEVSFSPDGTLVAFVRAHDLYVVDLGEARESAVTSDGGPRRRNGQLDWVYQEEIYGRGNFTGYWWSPDSTRVAYLQLDDEDVPDFPIVDHLAYHPELERWAYPKAGDPNPGVRLGIVRVAGGPTAWVDLDRYAPSEPLVVNVGWTPDSRHVVFQIQDREQTWLDLNRMELDTGRTELLVRETTDAWVDVNGPPWWLDDGTFLWLSERSGWRHLYHYRPDGTLLKQLTDGPWEVRDVHGVDDGTGWVYISGTERSHIDVDVYRVRLDGSGFTRLSERAGTHRARFNPGFTQYLDTWSDVATPPKVSLHAADGTMARMVEANDATPVDSYRLSTPELLQVSNRDGFVMNALMVKPPDFDPSVRYPVYQPVYGGPHTPRVRNAWGGQTYLYWQLLAQQGVIVWVLDNATASGKGAVSAWPVYKRFGELELRDLEDGLDWLAQQGYADMTRVGIEGWSYGGFMVTYALTHSRRYAMGIAGGSVTDWRDYDTIYTERYMRMPQNNPEGYRNSSPRFAAADLNGELLLIHGSMDENVHMQNTLQFAYELQQAGKPFGMMVYPKSRHRLGGASLEKHRHIMMLDFVRRHLRPVAESAVRTSAP